MKGKTSVLINFFLKFVVVNHRANDFCKDARRQTMKADDVFKAIEEMEFSEFLEPLKASLEGKLF